MGTRSLIGMTQQDGSVEFVYCHWDGHPSYNGAILHEHYREPAKIRQLIDLGDMSSLGPNIGPAHDFDGDRPDGATTFYGRDRGETSVGSKTAENAQAFLNQCYGTEFWYLFDRQEWWVSNGEKSVPVSPLMGSGHDPDSLEAWNVAGQHINQSPEPVGDAVPVAHPKLDAGEKTDVWLG